VAKANKQPEIDNDAETLKKALKRFEDSRDYQKYNWWEKWERDNKLYDGERANYSYEGLADTTVPMIQPMIETFVTTLANGTLRFDYSTGDPLKDPDTRALNGLIDEWWDTYGWDLNTEEAIREMGITGMAGNMLSWNIDHPEWETGAMRDYIVDPTITSPGDLQKEGAYAGRRYYVRKGALADYEKVDVDPKSKTYGELVKRYNIPENTGIAPQGTDDKTEKMLKEMFAGSTLSKAREDQDEILELWDIDGVVTIMNRSHVIEDVVNPYKQRHEDLLTQKYTEELSASFVEQGLDDVTAQEQALEEAKSQAKKEAKGLVPFFFFRNYRRSFNFYAKSEIDAVASHTELLNDLTNLETDSLIRQQGQQRELDPDYEDWLDLIDENPDTVYPFKPGSLQYIQRQQMSQNLFANRQNVKNEIREATSISQRSKGMDSPTDPTATEVRSTDAGTDTRIESKARILEKDGFYWMAKILFRMVQLYITEPMVVKVSGPSTRGKETGVYRGKQLPAGTAVYDPADFDSEFVPTISLEVDSKAKKQQNQKEALEQFKILIQDPTNNIPEIKNIYYPKIFDLDKADLDAILTPDPNAVDPMADPAMGGDPAAMQGAPMPQPGVPM
jgi:hypothetical protein